MASITNNVTHPMDIVDGQLQTNYTETYQKEDTKGTTKLGKDAFLKLLVTQLQYQDPLSPQSNEDFISQLAQFSALEEMQSMTGALANSQALSLVGKNVIMEVGKASGAATTTTVAGYVQYVQMVNGKAHLSINNELYSYEDLDTVVDDYYLKQVFENITGNNTDKETDSNDNTKDDANNDTSGGDKVE